jgi:hypothetical protein
MGMSTKIHRSSTQCPFEWSWCGSIRQTVLLRAQPSVLSGQVSISAVSSKPPSVAANAVVNPLCWGDREFGLGNCDVIAEAVGPVSGASTP